MDEQFKPFERLRKKEEIRNVFQRRGYNGTYNIIYLIPNKLPYSRLGLIVNRKVGNAVVRNRVKRLYREAFRRMKSRFVCKADIVIRAKPGAANATYDQIFEELACACEKNHLLQDGPES